jgi:hypothetical protein
METKLMAMVLGVALVLATATIYTQSAFAGAGTGGHGGKGANGANGQTAHGLTTACSHSNVAEHNPNCGSGGSAGGVLRVKPVEGFR